MCPPFEVADEGGDERADRLMNEGAGGVEFLVRVADGRLHGCGRFEIRPS
jgi:hypothetical protein